MNSMPAKQKVCMTDLSATFAANLVFLKNQNPKLYQRFVNYRPQKNELGLDEHNLLNITLDEHWLYEDASHNNNHQTIKQFLQHPTLLTTDSGGLAALAKPSTPTEHAHQKIAGLVQKHSKQDLPGNTQEPNYFPITISLGIGLGQHIPELIAQTQIDHLILFEPNPDFFYASLFAIDLAKITANFFDKKGKSIQFIIDQPYQSLLEELNYFKQPHQAQYLTKIALLSHYQTAQIKKTQQKLKQSYVNLVLHTGFIDDEIISLQNTHQNMLKRQFIHKQQNENHGTAVIIGSGPSVDECIELIAQYQQKCTVFSCSSSLQLCLNQGIIPDFHVESERSEYNYQHLKSIEPQTALGEIHLLNLNVAHPKMASLFGETTSAFKENDISTYFLKNSLQSMCSFKYANPTSGNGALAFALHLNFKNIILLGFDCGYKDKEQHHSKNSYYFTNKKAVPYTAAKSKNALKVKNNQGQLIYTDFLLLWSKRMIESALSTTNAVCINTGDGAHLAHTQWADHTTLEKKLELLKESQQIKHNPIIAKSMVISKSFDELHSNLKNQIKILDQISTCFAAEDFLENKTRDEDNFCLNPNQPDTQKKQKAIYALEKRMTKVNSLIQNKPEAQIFYKGSLQSFTTALATQILASNESTNLEELIQDGLTIFKVVLQISLNLIQKIIHENENENDNEN